MDNLQDTFIEDGLRLTGRDIERRNKFVGLGAGDVARIAAIRDVVARNADKFTAVFFGSLEGVVAAAGLLTRIPRMKRRIRAHFPLFLYKIQPLNVG